MRQDWIQQNEETIIGVSKKIWGYAELGRHEYKSSACLQELLRENGFQVTTGLGGLETSIKAEWGNGEPVIGFLGEFDALPDLSQKMLRAMDAGIICWVLLQRQRPLHSGTRWRSRGFREQ